MNGRVGIPLLLAAAALIVWGIAAGAASQHETFLGQGEKEQQQAAGSLVVLTSFLCAIGAGLIVIVLGNAPRLRRLSAAVQAGVGAWVLVALVQSDFPNYNVFPATETASLSESTLLVHGAGAPTVLLPLMALALVALWAIGDGLRRSRFSDATGPSLRSLARLHLGAVSVALPFLFMVALGAVRVMLSVPSSATGAGLAFALLPLAAAAALALVALLMLRVWHMAAALQDERLAPFTREVWRALDRVEWALAGVFVAAGVLSTALPTLDTAATGIGRTLVLGLRSHGQGLAFSMVPVGAAMLLHRRMGRRLANEFEGDASARRGAIGISIAGGTSLLLTVAGSGMASGLVQWILVLLPFAVFAGLLVPARAALPVMALAAWSLWARGNTIVADFDGDAFPTLAYDTHPGLLALWRIAGAAIAAWALHRVAVGVGANERPALRVPLGLAVGIGTVLVAVLQAPLWAWDESRLPINKVAVGSLLQSQSLGVQVLAHIISLAAAFAAAAAFGRLMRPEWFARRPRATPHPSAAPA